MQEKYGYFIEDLSVGMTAVFAKTVTDADITMFAGISGDTNPVHLDESFAEKTMFAGRIAHGMLSASFISTVFGTRLPGPGCIYLRQDLRFKAPVKVGDTVEARVTVKEILSQKKRVTFDTVCTVDETVVLEGEASLMVQARADVLGKSGEVSNQDDPTPIQAAE
ncbi:MAG: MaoC family dehydratase [Kiloniellaceae bacterium]